MLIKKNLQIANQESLERCFGNNNGKRWVFFLLFHIFFLVTTCHIESKMQHFKLKHDIVRS
jgi:hypothetical protein